MRYVLLAILCVLASPALSAEQYRRNMQVYGQANGPYGFAGLCQRKPDLCRPDARTQNLRVQLTAQRKRDLMEVNNFVNLLVKPCTDQEKYGVDEYWELLTCTSGTCCGDCEEYVVLKRKMLMQRGWPASALLITVVIDENGDGHAVLTARTRGGDFTLDNKLREVKLWSKTPYRYVMRQSYLNPTVWMALDPRAAHTTDLAHTRKASWQKGTSVHIQVGW